MSCAYAIVTVIIAGILIISLLYPKNHLIPRQMLVCTVLATAIFIGGMVIWNKIYPKVRNLSAIYWIGLTAFGIALYITSLCRIDNRYTLVDYTQIYDAACSLADGREIGNTYYFKIYSNNIQPMLLLSVLFRMADLLSVSRFHFVLAVSVLQVVMTVWSAGCLLEGENCKKWRFPILLLFSACLPIWGMTSAFYTDAMSFGLCMIAGVCMKKAIMFKRKCLDKQNGKAAMYLKWQCMYIGLSALAGALVVLAMTWKITAIFLMIAYGVSVILNIHKHRIKNYIPFLAFALFFYLALNCATNSLELVKEAKQTANPVMSWVALGMKDEGGWNSNREFIDSINLMSSTKEKVTATNQYIRENWKEFFNGEHLVKKLARNFANGNLGVYEFLFIEYDDGALLWDMFSPWGKYYWRTSQYCFSYIAMLYVAFLLGAVYCFVQTIKGKSVPTILMTFQISFMGLFIFLMIWEANNRQLYNQMPVFITGAVQSLIYIFEKRTAK